MKLIWIGVFLNATASERALYNISTSVSSQQYIKLIFVLFSMTNGLYGPFSSEHGVFADVDVLKHFSKKSKL